MTKRCKAVLLPVLLVLAASCTSGPATYEAATPNILWIFLEDTAPLMGPYGTTVIETPNLDALAGAGVVYTNAFMPAPVCSASRSSIITGTMSTTLGLHNHHSSRTEESAIHLPDGVQTIPELFNEAGYFSFNNGKDDYNFTYDRRDLYGQDYSRHPLYGKRGDPIDLADLKDRQPFFGQIQMAGGKEIFSSRFDESVETPVDRDAVELPPYLPAHPAIVEEYADHLDAIQITDRKVGLILDELRDNGLLENTIVFFFSDHGMRITRNKQFLYDGGLHVPLVIADFREQGALRAGTTDDVLISGIDLGTSALALAGIPIPDYMEGIDIFAEGFDGREFVISTRDRCDFTIDRIRSVRTKQFKYIRNFLTDRPYTQTTYMDVDGVEFVQVMRELHADNQLNADQARFFSNERPAEELYDLENDPFELNNLVGSPDYESVRQEHAAILDNWIATTDDQGQYPENVEGLKLMLGIWGDYAANPEYEPLRRDYEGLSGSLFELKSHGWEPVGH
jgi:N-sulfoglucosamine sulfohydrolase